VPLLPPRRPRLSANAAWILDEADDRKTYRAASIDAASEWISVARQAKPADRKPVALRGIACEPFDVGVSGRYLRQK
jgi:hypothetical protein